MQFSRSYQKNCPSVQVYFCCNTFLYFGMFTNDTCFISNLPRVFVRYHTITPIAQAEFLYSTLFRIILKKRWSAKRKCELIGVTINFILTISIVQGSLEPVLPHLKLSLRSLSVCSLSVRLNSKLRIEGFWAQFLHKSK
jgi:hypothetical protein